jgi:hypothetical protein
MAGDAPTLGEPKERVAFDLMRVVQAHTPGDTGSPEYWFKLYHQCHALVVWGHDAKSVLAQK